MEEIKFTITDIPVSVTRSGSFKYEPIVKALLENPNKALSFSCKSRSLTTQLQVTMRAGVQSGLRKMGKEQWKAITRTTGTTLYFWLERRNVVPATRVKK